MTGEEAERGVEGDKAREGRQQKGEFLDPGGALGQTSLLSGLLER